MIECVINGWILSVMGSYKMDKYVYSMEAVDNYLINNHWEELIDYAQKRDVPYGDCVETSFDGLNSEEFFHKEPTRFTVLFMLGQRTNFL